MDATDARTTSVGCRRTLPLTDFPLRRKDGIHRYGHCRDCKAFYQKQWYERNKAWHKANVASINAEIRRVNKEIVSAAKSRPCANCGSVFMPIVMDFDHVQGDKLGNIAWLKMRSSTAVLLREIEKCDVVCANCHRIRTFYRGQGTK